MCLRISLDRTGMTDSNTDRSLNKNTGRQTIEHLSIACQTSVNNLTNILRRLVINLSNICQSSVKALFVPTDLRGCEEVDKGSDPEADELSEEEQEDARV